MTSETSFTVLRPYIYRKDDGASSTKKGNLPSALVSMRFGTSLRNWAPVRIGRKWGYIDTSGRMVVEPRFQSAGEFHEGLARVHLWSKVVCTSGEFTSDDAPLWAFHLIEDDKSDLVSCFPQGGKFGYIDKSGKVIIAPQFFAAKDFADGLAAVRVEETADSKYGYIDRTGRMVITPRFNQAGPFSEGLAPIGLDNRLQKDCERLSLSERSQWSFLFACA